MLIKFEERDTVINAIVKKIDQNMPGDQARLCAEFIRQFYSNVPIDDLHERSIDDLYGEAINFWTIIKHREPNENKIHIYNPDFERYGWQTTHTIVEVVCTDRSFLVDSMRMVINRMGLSLHLIIHLGGIRLIRNAKNEIIEILPRHGEAVEGSETDAPILMEIDRQTDPAILRQLETELTQALEESRVVVEDWEAMRNQVKGIIDELNHLPKILDNEEVNETKAFLNWLEDHHFTFLGVRDYELVEEGKETLLQAIPGTGYGVLRESFSKSNAFNISLMTSEARELTLSARILVMSKTNSKSNVHRDAYTDYIGVKRFNKKGKVIGERRILGLYTSAAYNTTPKHIPFLRHKIALILKNSLLNPRSHAGRVLINILETLPRDDLIQGTEQELLEISMGIFHMQERRRIRMFARLDPYHRFISCFVFVPRDKYNTELRRAMEKICAESFNAKEISFSTYFSESVLARIHFMIRINPKANLNCDFKEVEKKLIEVGRSWMDDLQHVLLETYGEEQSNRLFARYKKVFPNFYMSIFPPRIAVSDIKYIEQLSPDNPLVMNFYRPLDEFTDNFRLKIYQHDITIPLSDVLPIIENLGLRAISERPYELKFEDGRVTWIIDFSMHYTRGSKFNIEAIKDLFQNAFSRIWFGDAENDGFNQLVLAAGLDWRQVAVLRAYAKYFKQIGFTFSQEYIVTALNNNPIIARKLVELFELRFDPQLSKDREKDFHLIEEQIMHNLDEVANLDEDKIIRQFVQVISATLRTNYYQYDIDGHAKPYLSLKLDSKSISGMPRPYPRYEIFVYSPKFEAIHLRSSKVARGGLRWSDRREDFRTEILGLMKAQQVKNAVIVPNGAKGGFVMKKNQALLATMSREEILAEGVYCYKQFIRGLLDITDNYKEGGLVKPREVVSYDEDDPYLVVAADKGTATFSDIANEIALEQEFWLGDAFASGGSIGYDHKKMGITARGAWESVKRHFYELNLDIETTDFTVVGIGDMAGDVFGNGMLLSKHIKLVGAFNHMHIFLDPDPDSLLSFKERERLFHLPRSTWADYDKNLISKGGGVFNRNAKSITLTKEIRQLLGIKSKVHTIEPNELIQLILRAKVDLLWSAGIGTFIKAETESNLDVGDRSNDLIRVDAKTLQCRTVVEGGNLGLTQLARVEYALAGGLNFTDFIDNSAGVSCSDKEVNIKILLNNIVAAGDLTYKQRNELLAEMTDEVAHIVLNENYLQTLAISLSATLAVRGGELHSRYINELEKTGKLDRFLEFLPENKGLMERRLMGKGLTRPEIAILHCYSKIILKEAMLDSEIVEDPFLKCFLISAFPNPLQNRFAAQMEDHPLKREIIATRVSNTIINEMGFSFIYRLQDETGAPTSAIVSSYMIARSILRMDTIWRQIEALDKQIDAKQQTELMTIYVRTLRRLSRWFLRNKRMRLDITHTIEQYAGGIQTLQNTLPDILGDEYRERYLGHYQDFIDMGLSEDFAQEITSTRGLFAAMDIIDIAQKVNIPIPNAANAYFGVGEFLEIDWIRTQVIIHTADNHWEALSREALRDDIDLQQRQLTSCILEAHPDKDFAAAIESWASQHTLLINRWRQILTNLRSSSSLNYTLFFVAIRELLDLTQTTMQTVGYAEGV